MYFSAIVVALLAVQWVEASYVFTNSCRSQKELVERLQFKGFIKSKRVADVMLQVDRKNYIPWFFHEDMPVVHYWSDVDSPPSMFAFSLEMLKSKLKEGNRALDVGYGSGYLCACMAIMVGKTGRVVGIEYTPELVPYANKAVRKGNPTLLEGGRIRFVDGFMKAGVPEYGPYDAINVAVATKIVPQTLLDQLKNGGKMVIKIGQAGIVDEMNVFRKDKYGNVSMSRKKGSFYVKDVLEDLYDKPVASYEGEVTLKPPW